MDKVHSYRWKKAEHKERYESRENILMVREKFVKVMVKHV